MYNRSYDYVKKYRALKRLRYSSSSSSCSSESKTIEKLVKTQNLADSLKVLAEKKQNFQINDLVVEELHEHNTNSNHSGTEQ